MAQTKKIDVLASVTPTEAPHVSKGTKELAKDKLTDCIARDSKLVKGTFDFTEMPGGNLPLDLPQKYKGLPPFKKVLEDGKVYEVPRWVADWLNGKDISKDAFNPQSDQTINSCAVGVSHFKVAKDEVPGVNLDSVPAIGQKFRRRMRFIPLGFGED